MKSLRTKTVRCQVSGKDVPLDDAVPADLVRSSLLEILKTRVKDWDREGYVSVEALNEARMQHFTDMVDVEEGELRELHREVAESMRNHELVSKHADSVYETQTTRGQRVADAVARFGGSWSFIGSFGAVLFVWIVINVVALREHAFDPYPFILLNLILSCIAALQAPVIMMSQNRQEEKDRLRSQNDYKVNLKAELEIRHLHEKIDRLINDQWKHLLEIQQMQMEMIEELTRAKSPD